MGFNFRKSFNLGKYFKINLSKSGIGFSFGVPGFRVTKTANGKLKKTISVPGTGLSYTDDIGKKETKPKEKTKKSTKNTAKTKKKAEGLFCPNCGEKVAKTAKFCKNCGAELNTGDKN